MIIRQIVANSSGMHMLSLCEDQQEKLSSTGIEILAIINPSFDIKTMQLQPLRIRFIVCCYISAEWEDKQASHEEYSEHMLRSMIIHYGGVQVFFPRWQNYTNRALNAQKDTSL